MECPKCGAEVDNNTTVCPNCKKVLKIACPVCRTLNEKHVCKKCGTILLIKCEKCGKVNVAKTKDAKCQKCGMPLALSAIKAEANTDDFAVLRIDFPNKGAVKNALNNNQIFVMFMQKIDAMIMSVLKPLELRREIIDGGAYIIRFDKDYTLKSSVNTAINTALEFIKSFIKVNSKILKKKNIVIKANFSIFKRGVNNNPLNSEFGFNANMINEATSFEDKVLDAVQIIINDDFYEAYKEEYNPESLNSVMVNGEMKRFYGIKVAPLVDLSELIVPEEITKDEIEVPDFVQDMLQKQDKLTKEILKRELEIPEEELLKTQSIDFQEKNCLFISTESANVIDEILTVLQGVPKGILAIKASELYMPYTIQLLSNLAETNKYESILPITCYDDMKYVPYSFFRELLSSIFQYSVSNKLSSLNNFSDFSSLDPDGLVRDLINLSTRGMGNLEQVRDEYFQVFMEVFKSIPNTMIYIENFEKMDPSSMFIMDKMFDYMEEMNLSYVVHYNSDFSLHRKFQYLMVRPDYTEITLLPTPFSKIVKANKNMYKEIKDDFYFQRIEKYACGSSLFLDYVIQYMVECGVYSYGEDVIHIENPQTIVIPSNLDNLIQRRLNLLKDNQDAMQFLIDILYIGPRVDNKALANLGFQNWQELVTNLAEMGYIYNYNDCVYFSNYNLLKRNITEVIDNNQKVVLANNLNSGILEEGIPNPLKPIVANYLGQIENLIPDWENLANLALSLGDFPAYINCTKEILKCLDKYSENRTKEELDEYKMMIYENIANNMTEYVPEQTRAISDQALVFLTKAGNRDCFVRLATKMIQGYLIIGDYKQALKLINSVLQLKEGVSINPSSPNFDFNFLLLIVLQAKALFNTGAYKGCIQVCYNILNVLDSSKLKSLQYTEVDEETFKNFIAENVAYALISMALSLDDRIDDYFKNAKTLLSFIPNDFEFFKQIKNLLLVKEISIPDFNPDMNPLTIIIYNIIKAYATCKDQPEVFVQEVYKSKLLAQESYQHSLELFIDALIGYSYLLHNSFQKARYILNKVLITAREKGLNTVIYSTMYIISIYHIQQRRPDLAYEVLNNATVQMEKSGEINDYMLMLEKMSMGQILMGRGENEQAKICLEQAIYIMKKYKFNIDFKMEDFEKQVEQNQKNEEPVSGEG